MDPKDLQEYISYDYGGGRIYRAGTRTPALCTIHASGYLKGKFNGKVVYAHRAAWAMYYGEWPVRKIVHLNGDRADNRIVNLALAGAAHVVHDPVPSPCKGVTWSHNARKWKAQVRVDGNVRHLGYFREAKNAQAAYELALDRRSRGVL